MYTGFRGDPSSIYSGFSPGPTLKASSETPPGNDGYAEWIRDIESRIEGLQKWKFHAWFKQGPEP